VFRYTEGKGRKGEDGGLIITALLEASALGAAAGSVCYASDMVNYKDGHKHIDV